MMVVREVWVWEDGGRYGEMYIMTEEKKRDGKVGGWGGWVESA
jgi:hypothetical protein